MKVYVASKFENYEAVREAVHFVKSLGHEVTHDWTATDEFGADGKPGNSNGDLSLEDQQRHAAADFLGVRRADCLLLLGHPAMCGGMVEFGVALALGKPIAVVAPERCFTIFYTLPGVTTHVDVGFALDALGLVPDDWPRAQTTAPLPTEQDFDALDAT